MRVLMVSPHPVYSPRGTPISVFNRCLALCALGHEVDLVTYPIGDDLPVDGLRYLRSPVPGVRAVVTGPSLAKIPLNVGVAVHTARQIVRRGGHYDVVHSHEEAGPLGLAAARWAGVPHVYDMGNGWGTVLANYGLRSGGRPTRWAQRAEEGVAARSAAVLAHFPALADELSRRRPDARVHVAFNVPLEPEPGLDAVLDARTALSPDGRPVALYTGTLEPYQGMPDLVEAFADPRLAAPGVRLAIAGGRADQIAALRSVVLDRGLTDRIEVLGSLPPTAVPAYLEAADVLVSPRRTGANTPLKIFAYLRAGRPIVATDIESHRQVLDPAQHVLVEPSAEGLASGVLEALGGRRPGDRPPPDQRFSTAAYVAAVAAAYADAGAPAPDVRAATERIHELSRLATPATHPMPLLASSSAT